MALIAPMIEYMVIDMLKMLTEPPLIHSMNAVIMILLIGVFAISQAFFSLNSAFIPLLSFAFEF